ncbi:hypothetical protein [Chryseobacterium sp.]|jgi:hypothetical protein|uniref:hypothetical protein n=1 Tax=Chryseobacterium sp. TaxID=1871047 RepID=UPI00284C7B65|nr:hypothetical protein [Chryseobacterium sp.]MDR3026007.1 hypothetical protein [Chryseobacterium sp.]
MATIAVLLSSLLPFLNNIVKRFYDTTSIVFNNVSGARNLDLDSCIFFLSMPFAYLFIFIGTKFGAHRFSYYTFYISCYFQLAFILNFIFLDKNEVFFFAEAAVLLIFIAIGIILFFVERYFKKLALADEFKEKALDRSLSLLSKKRIE